IALARRACDLPRASSAPPSLWQAPPELLSPSPPARRASSAATADRRDDHGADRSHDAAAPVLGAGSGFAPRAPAPCAAALRCLSRVRGRRRGPRSLLITSRDPKQEFFARQHR